MRAKPSPVFFNESQLGFSPRYEWTARGVIAYPESPARAEAILAALARESALFELREPARVPMDALRELHSPALLTLYESARELDIDWYPTVFPKRTSDRADPTNLRHAGAWCLDVGTPLSGKLLEAAGWSAACAQEAARAVQGGAELSYALSRPPGHHAESNMFGGYCYFNNCALAARELRQATRAKVAVLDIDFHHGNGTQSLFEADPNVLTISLHGDPRTYFPYHMGYPEETGRGAGAGLNLNIALESGTDGQAYLEALKARALPRLESFDPAFVVVAAGLDGYERDPVGDFALSTEDFYRIGEAIGAMGRPVVAIQEGGYHAAHLGRNAVALLRGLRAGLGLEE